MKVVKIPFVNGDDSKGSRFAPEKLIEGLKEIYTNSYGKEINSENLVIEEIEISKSLEESNDIIYRKCFLEYSENQRLCFLGGDHSMSYATTRSFFDYCENNSREPCLIVFDAHLDLMDPADRKVPRQEEWLKGLIKDGFPLENILIVGVRNAEISELEFSKGRIKRMPIGNFLFDLEAKTDAIMEFGYGKDVYVSIDFDVLDPAFAPGVNYPEPGGFNSKEFLYIAHRLNKMKNLRVVDFVEINPLKDFNKMACKLGAKILAEFL